MQLGTLFLGQYEVNKQKPCDILKCVHFYFPQLAHTRMDLVAVLVVRAPKRGCSCLPAVCLVHRRACTALSPDKVRGLHSSFNQTGAMIRPGLTYIVGGSLIWSRYRQKPRILFKIPAAVWV